MLSAKIRDLKTRTSFYRVEKLKKVKKFLFINFFNDTKTNLGQRNWLLLFFLKKKQKIKQKKSS